MIQACNYTFMHYFFPSGPLLYSVSRKEECSAKNQLDKLQFLICVFFQGWYVVLCHRIYCFLTTLAPVTESASSLHFQQFFTVILKLFTYINDLFFEHFSGYIYSYIYISYLACEELPGNSGISFHSPWVGINQGLMNTSEHPEKKKRCNQCPFVEVWFKRFI